MFWQKLLATTAGTSLVLMTGISASAEAASIGFSKMYVFGDSLSDSGNVFDQIGVPPAPYFNGRFSNGPNWVDYLAQDLNLSITPVEQLSSPSLIPTQSVNFAVGGATTDVGNTVVPFLLNGLQQEVQTFIQHTSNTADPDALYLLWAGANDYLPTTTPMPPGLEPPFTVDRSITNLTAALTSLLNAGAKNIAIANLPALGSLPLTRGTPLSAPLNGLAAQHNQQLSQTLATLRSTTYPSANLIALDFASLLAKHLNPATSAFAYTDTGYLHLAIECATVPTPKCAALQTPDQFLFWDATHPTTHAHRLLATAALETIDQAIPEPSISLGLVAFGTWGATSMLKRRKPSKQGDKLDPVA